MDYIIYLTCLWSQLFSLVHPSLVNWEILGMPFQLKLKENEYIYAWELHDLKTKEVLK